MIQTISHRALLLVLPFAISYVAIYTARCETNEPNAYAEIDALFEEHCLDCHSHDDPDAGLNLENYESLIKGGQNGSPILGNDSERSPLVRLLIGFTDPNDKQRIMPPGKRQKLSLDEINLVKQWIESGSPAPPKGWKRPINLDIPAIETSVAATEPIHAIAYTAQRKQLAIGKYRTIELVNPTTQSPIRTLSGHSGNINGLVFHPNGKLLFSAAGEPGIFGELKKWDIESGALLQTFRGHHDAIYALAISHDGSILATGSYDQMIHLWDTSDGTLLRSLAGHQGAVFDLDFRVDDKILASASADRTIKLWNVQDGKRVDTLSQPLKEQHTVLFSKDGKRLFAGGVDSRIRIWEISETARETSNPIIETRFAHEGTILSLHLSSSGKLLASSADDRTVKLWDSGSLKERFQLPDQSDWSTALVFTDKDQQLVIGRLDGSIAYYESANGKRVTPPKPSIARMIPQGIPRGAITRVAIEGQHLSGVDAIEFKNPLLHAALAPSGNHTSERLEILIFSDEKTPLGSNHLQLRNELGSSERHEFYIDKFPQIVVNEASQGAKTPLSALPINAWSTISKSGQTDRYSFEVDAGQGIVFDIAASKIGSKADLVMTLSNEMGQPIASSHGFDNSKDPLLFHRFESSGRYQVDIEERFLKASPDHYYRMTIGSYPFVTDVSPRIAPPETTLNLQLIGYNLDEHQELQINTGTSATHTVSLDKETLRFRTSPKLELQAWSPIIEQEPNDNATRSTQIAIGQNATGRIWTPESSQADVDYYRFRAIKDQALVVETIASRIGSPLDTRIEILSKSGQPLKRLLLEAVRDTAINFRPITSTAGGARLDHWEEMSLNDYLFMNGEVVKLFLAPRGPDSSWDFYPASGTRRTYFDTTSTAHANFEPCYIVRAHPPESKLLSNGLPRFTLYYENDDHSESQKGSDSRIYFNPPETGEYLVRVIDSRRQESPRYVYHLVVRERQLDFDVTFSNRNLSINQGSGRSFTLKRKRIDGFDGPIEMEVSGLPAGITASSPITIEAGHHQATGTLFADESVTSISPEESLNIEITASANIDGHERIKAIQNFGKLSITEAPKLYVKLEPSNKAKTTISTRLIKTGSSVSIQDINEPYPVIEIQPGTTIPAKLSVRRNGHSERITFSISNLPHGIIVDNIGLNGVLMPPDVSEREIFLKAADWVQETERLCHAIANEAGGQTSRPVILRVVKKLSTTTSPSGN